MTVEAMLERPAGARPDMAAMMASAKDAAEFLKALAHEHRLLLLCLLAERPRTVSELEELLDMRQPAVSQQLARLRLDGLVAAKRDGKAVTYSIADENVRKVIGVLYDAFCAGCAT